MKDNLTFEEMMSAQDKADRGVLTSKLASDSWLDLDAKSVTHYSDGVNRIYKGEIEGMLIRGLFSQEEMLHVKHKLDRKQDTRSSVIYGEIIGSILVAKGKEKSDYFRNADILRIELEDIFETPFEATVEAILSKMSGERTVELPRENNRTYTPATIRFVYPNRGIPLHKGNEFLADSAYDRLKQIAKMTDSLSYFIVIDKPEKGGELVIYDPPPDQLTNAKKDLDLEKCQKRYINPSIGDLVLFQGGSIWHEVSEVQGTKERITIGGFLAISKCDRKIFYWS
jgi:hypothetical protein